jgi:hypothetical protein
VPCWTFLVGRETDMSDAPELVPYAVKTYRYLRLAIVVVVLSLLASVLIERLHVSCWQDSISAYYYTPVHAVFVGALVAIGVSLIAIKGSTDVEDVLLNVAGVLAPIVAFVPTSAPSGSCPSTAIVGVDTKAYIDNNVLALAIGGGIAIAVSYVIARLMGKATIRKVDPSSVIGLVIGVMLMVVGLVWYAAFRDNFLDHAHRGAAAAMFSIVAFVMVINARSARRGYRTLYALTVTAMVLSAVGVFVGKLVHGEWRHQILWIETLELLPFAVYWAAQTFEHWDGGVPTGPERTRRAADSRIGFR